MLGGSAPHEDAAIDQEGGSLTAGLLGTTSGPDADSSIRDAMRVWARGMSLTLGVMPGASVGRDGDFGVGRLLLKLKGRVSTANLLSTVRFVLDQLCLATHQVRTRMGALLPDLAEIVTKAGSEVFAMRRRTEILSDIARAQLEPLQAELQELLARVRTTSSGTGRSRGAAAPSAAPAPSHQRPTRWGPSRAVRASATAPTAAPQPPSAAPSASASALAAQFLASVPQPPVPAPAAAQPVASSPADRVHSESSST